MRQIRLGELKERRYLGGEKVLRFENYFYFQLKHGFYHKASETFNWSDGSKGIGLNRHIILNTPIHRLVIENRHTEKFYVCTDIDKLIEQNAKDVQKGKELVVFPLSGFEQVEIRDKENLKDEQG